MLDPLYIAVKAYPSETAIVDAYRQEANDSIWAGVVFTGDFSNGWPKDITYKLRVTKDAKNRAADWLTDYTFNYFQTFGFRNNDTRGDKPGKKTIISRSYLPYF